MVLMRATPATALPTVRQIAGDLLRCVRDAGTLTSPSSLVEDIARLQQYGIESQVDVDVALDVGMTAERCDRVARWLSPQLDGATLANSTGRRTPIELTGTAGRPVRIVVRAADRLPAQAAGVPPAPVVVWIVGDGSSESISPPELPAEDAPIVVILAPGGEQGLRGEAAAVRGRAWHVEFIDVDALPAWSFEERLGSAPWSPVLDVARADAGARALEAMAGVATQVLDHELRGFKAKRTLLQQRVAKLQQKGTSAPAEVVGDVRSRLQRHFSDFARGLDDRLQSLLAAPNGTLFQEVEEQLAAMPALTREDRLKTTSTRVSPEFEEELLETVHARALAHGSRDLVAMRDMFRLVQTEVEQLLATHGGPPIVLQLQYLTDDRLRKLLDMQVLLQRRYPGELPRAGFFEYVMIARRYQMVFFMFFSAFGLSFLRTYREFMIPTAILLLSFGAINVINSVRRERTESLEREMEKAREMLRADLRRMFSEVQRGWTATVAQHLSDQVPLVVGQVESALRESAGRRGEAASEDRQRLQRQLQGLETSERRLQSVSKARDLVANAVAQIRGELRQLFVSALKAAPRPSV